MLEPAAATAVLRLAAATAVLKLAATTAVVLAAAPTLLAFAMSMLPVVAFFLAGPIVVVVVGTAAVLVVVTWRRPMLAVVDIKLVVGLGSGCTRLVVVVDRRLFLQLFQLLLHLNALLCQDALHLVDKVAEGDKGHFLHLLFLLLDQLLEVRIAFRVLVVALAAVCVVRVFLPPEKKLLPRFGREPVVVDGEAAN